MKRFRAFRLKMPKNYDKMMHLCMLVLLLFGTIMIASTSVGESSKNSNVVIIALVKQMVFLIGSYFVMTYAARNFTKFLAKEVRIKNEKKENRKYKNAYRTLFRLSGYGLILLCASTLLFPAVNGSHAWIDLKVMTLQPSEFAKVYMVVLIGLVVNDLGPYQVKFMQFAKEPLIFFIPIILILLLQPDFGTFLVFTSMTAICLLIPTTPALRQLRRLILIGFALAGAAVLFFSTNLGISLLENMNLGYKFSRFTSAADPFKDLFGEGYNIVYSLYAIANGGLSGLGLGGSEQKFGYLPEAQTDFIFSVTIEELGLLGLLIIVVCYIVILYKLFYYAMKTKSEGFKVILIGCALYLMIHFILNVGGVSALIPLTGVPLLFISSGGSSLLSIMLLLGICQSIIALTKSQMNKMDMERRT